MQRYIAEGARVLERMERDSLRGNAVSQELLMRLVRENQDTEYGRRYGFRDIRSYADYAEKVPLSSYEDYKPYIERMLCFNAKNLLTADEVAYYAHTSGTTGASKMIPCTRRALDVFFTAGNERVFALCDAICRERTGEGMPICKGITMMELRIGYTTFGVAHGALSETVLIPEDTGDYIALPEELVYPTSDFDRRHLKMLFALRERRLSFMMCSFTPFLEAMAEETGTAALEYSVYADAETDPGHYIVLLESDREVRPEDWPRYSEALDRKLCGVHDSYRQKIERKIMAPWRSGSSSPRPTPCTGI